MNDAVQTRLTISNVFARSATELAGCVRIMRDIEARLLPVVVHAASQDEGAVANSALQDIDLLVQTLEDLELLMSGLAGTDGAEALLQAQFPLSRMRLFDLRQRIAGATSAESTAVERISLF